MSQCPRNAKAPLGGAFQYADMAEAVRFELTEESPLRRFSSLSLNSGFMRVAAGFRFRNSDIFPS
ncbi:hypothetical protein N0346_31315, partial [Pseudomonas aeruginosa]|nr:hypothetical protein [Pseudomonas aeruginosa]MCS9308340.1 hypothetical protein [Pseudomonas aeruginosa]